jgi:DNA-binding Xre family transcriptional regulator
MEAQMAGTVQFRVPEKLLEEAGLDPTNASVFARRIDVSWPTGSDLLAGEIAQIKMVTLGKLCDYFSQQLGRIVKPGEFLEYIPEAASGD